MTAEVSPRASGTTGAGTGSAILGFPSTIPFAGLSPSTVVLNNRIYACRVTGSGTITKIRIHVGVQSGNICVGVYTGGTSGIAAAVPGTRKGTSGSVSCPAPGAADVALTGSVVVNEGDWLAIMADNNTATFMAVGGGTSSSLFTGMSAYTGIGGTTLPLPDPAPSLPNLESKVYIMDGVA